MGKLTRSPDGRLCIFQWDERTGGSFRALKHVVFYRDAKGAGHGTYMYGLGEGYDPTSTAKAAL